MRVRAMLVMLATGWVMLALAALVGRAAAELRPGPAHPPTRGEVWPKPHFERKQQEFYTFDTSNFQIKVTGYNCSILWNGIHRYSYVVRELPGVGAKYAGAAVGAAPDSRWRGALRELRVNVTQPCVDGDRPHLDMDESYELSVSSQPQHQAELTAPSVWGALRGLETFAQLFYLSEDYTEVRVNATLVRDRAECPHRGLLVDTSRHFLPPRQLRAALDALAINKMNVLHWHLVDDQSFPYRSDRFPELSDKGAYHPSMVYTAADIEDIVEYARQRGIRVIPEIDVPGHTRSWGAAYPDVLTPCGPDGPDGEGALGPMHPLRNITYRLLGELLAEARLRFPDQYFHIGGDEVDLSCWASNPELAQYMQQHNMTSPRELHALFMRRALPLLATNTPLVWQEVYDEAVPLPNDTIVHVWKSSSADMVDVLEAGHRALYSTEWYLDHLQATLEAMLQVDPRAAARRRGGERLARRVLGGEACMWGEMVDDTNFLSRVWPRASAVAERLWSPPLTPPAARGRRGGRRRRAAEHDLRRAEEHACRMRRRGVPAEPPSGPGFCAL